jgi:hypothetical protein
MAQNTLGSLAAANSVIIEMRANEFAVKIKLQKFTLHEYIFLLLKLEHFFTLQGRITNMFVRQKIPNY